MMDQEDTNRVSFSQDQVKELTDMVKELLQLIEALPSIEEDFFSTPLTKEERKETKLICPRTAVKKADTTLHGIQVALAQATRPIDYYVHRRIQNNPQVNEDDPHILFASTIRVLLSDIASTVTQGRLDNLHKGMELPGKPHQLFEPDTKPLMDQEKLDALIASKRPEKRPRIRMIFRGLQQYGTQNDTSSKPVEAQTSKLHLRSPHLITTPRSQIFAGEGACIASSPNLGIVQAGKISYDYVTVHNPPGQSKGAVDSITACQINVEETNRAEEQISFKDEIMDIDSYTERAIIPEFVILGAQIELMKHLIIPS
ncbi:hypothetical protein AYI69_g5058 [Smittium culicis]|uniref:Uncharacterized protein n=1 Tax=Smittium culicis TaxID=133412 RepID=A0A1R1Y8Q8_9FUNG|nr:hypothetical protein AYI69_g5058 [Smittium culicis]